MSLAWCARSFLGELGDKTFLLAAVFTIWCPYEGVRASKNSVFQQLVVFLGVLCALWARCILFILTNEPGFWDGYCEGVSCLFLLLMIPKAYWDFCDSDVEEQKRREVMLAATKRAAAKDGFEGPLGMYGVAKESEVLEDPSYGAAIAPRSSADGLFDRPIPDHLASTIMAFFVPAALVFAADAEDKSAAVWLDAGKPGNNGDVLFALLGVVGAVAVAVCLGFILERQVSDHRLNFAVLGVFSTLFLVSLSQALLHLDGLTVADSGDDNGVKASLLTMLGTKVVNSYKSYWTS